MGTAPLNTGAVNFYPDAAKGNKDGNVYVSQIDEQGQYKLFGGGKEGAPAGWYKVTVNASAPPKPNQPYAVTQPLVDEKFTKVDFTPLAVEVKPDAPPGAYDLKVTKRSVPR
jgi:hypothetical protein